MCASVLLNILLLVSCLGLPLNREESKGYNVRVIFTEEERKREEVPVNVKKGWGRGGVLQNLQKEDVSQKLETENDKQTSGGAVTKALTFLHQFGYLPKGIDDAEALYRQEGIETALKRMQFFGGIPQTGQLDNATVELMQTPRCGVTDVPVPHSRKKRFVIGSEGWNKRNISYFVANWSNKIGGRKETLEVAERAFRVWSNYAPLIFTHVEDPRADIILGFTTGPHGDGYPFDGPGFILAHAFYPYESGGYGGDVHFDDDEAWELQTKDDKQRSTGIDLFTVMVHELGHSLGLAHSPVPGSIMYPYYKGTEENLQLDYDDVLAMYQLYITRRLEGDEELVTTLPDVPEPRVPPTNVPLPPPELPPDDTDVPLQPPQLPPDGTDVPLLPPELPPDDTDEQDHHPTFDDKDDEDDIFRDWESKKNTTSPPPTQFPKLKNPTYEGDFETVEEHKSHADLPPTVPSRQEPPNLCEGTFDAISVIRRELFIFKEHYLWRLPKIGQLYPGYPVEFRRFFHQLPEWVHRIDALYQRPTDGNVILFTGRWFWVYDGDSFIQTNGQPFLANSEHQTCNNCARPLRELGIPAGLSRVDAALVWKKNGKTYFFSSNLYWRYNETAKRMDRGYPHDIARWRGVPYNLNAALQYTDGISYFFKGANFWRFDDYAVKTDSGYPLPAPQVWAGCSDVTIY